MKHVEYMIVEANSAFALEREVTLRLKTGCTLQGGVAMATVTQDGNTTETWYAQALILEFEGDE